MTAPLNDDDRLDLLLADAEDWKPALGDGLPSDAAQTVPKPKKEPRGEWERTDADRNDLAAQRWAVVAPEGPEGNRLLEAMTPLIRLREAEQGAPAKIYRVPPEMDTKQAIHWKDEVHWAEDVPEDERPLYLLLLGGLHQVSVDFQHVLAHQALVGRAHFAGTDGATDLDGYETYAKKVVQFAHHGTPDTSPDMLFYVAQDGSSATRIAEAKLIDPSIAAVKEGGKKAYPIEDLRELDAMTTDDLLAACESSRPSVLMSVSHGLGPPRRGFKSEDEQQQRQGALVLGRGELLDAERMRGQRFLPGGMWFCLACYGAGTPSTSVYGKWLEQLAESGAAYGGSVEEVRKGLPKNGQPFVAAMPQAALANPEGPLAVLGHVDLAWTYGFSNATKLSESRKSRILSALQVMVRGSRAGIALEALMRSYRETNNALMESYEREAAARIDKRPDPTDHVERSHLWMLRNDLRGYILLGDPAARLPLKQFALRQSSPEVAPPEVQSAPTLAPAKIPAMAPADPSPRASEEGSAEVPMSAKEAAVLALTCGDEAPRAIAARAGVSLDALWAWFHAFHAAGRARLEG